MKIKTNLVAARQTMVSNKSSTVVRSSRGTPAAMILLIFALCSFSASQPVEASQNLGIPSNSSKCFLKDSPTFQEFKNMIQNPACNIRSIDDVLEKLPAKMKQNFALYYKSKSLQGPHTADYLNPRAILTTEPKALAFPYPRPKETGFVVTFNGKPTQANYQNLEVLQINVNARDTKDIYQYFDVQFPSEAGSESLSWEQIQAGIKFSEPNPSSCVSCHGSPARPIFSGYPLWEGSYGSKHLTRDKNEVAGFKAFMASAKSNPQSRYRHLQFEKVREGFVDPEHDGILMGIKNVEINSMFQGSNGFRIAKLMMDTPQYAQFKYAFLGALVECENFEEFFPKWTWQNLERNLERTYNLQAAYPKAQVKEIMSRLGKNAESQFGDMGSLQSGVFPEDVPSVLETFKNFVGTSETFERLATDTFQHQGYHRVSKPAVALRFLMEGRGLSMSSWFLDLQQPTYRMNHGGSPGYDWALALMQSDPEFKEKLTGALKIQRGSSNDPVKPRLCSDLKKESLSALEAVGAIPATAANFFKRTTSDKSYPRVFATTCARCHEDEKIGPRIPFKNPEAFKNWIGTDSNFAKLSYKLQAREGESMPPTFKLSSDEIQDLLNYIDFARKK